VSRRLVAGAFALSGALLTLCAEAHQNSVTYVRIEAEGRSARVEARIAAIDLNEAVRAPPGVELSRQNALDASGAAAEYVRRRVTLESAGRRCVAGEHDAHVADRRGDFELVVGVRYECARVIDDLSVRYDLFFDVDPRHQGMATLRAFDRASTHVFVARDRTASLRSGRTLGRQLAEYLRLGVEHIFQGYDHIAFLCGLLLVLGTREARRGVRDVAAIVTSFTLAHSITLVGAALGWFTLPSSVVEPAIALSIAYVAVENLVVTEPKHRRALTFAFGLVHGFGFAGVLAEQGLPSRAVVPSLLAFNGGVEVGQLAVVALAGPVLTLLARPVWSTARVALALASLATAYGVLAWAGVGRGALAAVLFGAVPLLAVASRRWGYDRGVRRLGSVALGVFGLLWFLERVTGWNLAHGAFG
jgi:HupE / UreJ protein